jgi:hypothetical protein
MDVSVAEYLQACRAPNTHRAYAYDLVDFTSWGGTIPSTPEQVARYLAQRAPWRFEEARVRMAKHIRNSSTKSALPQAVVFAGVFLAVSTASAAPLTLPSEHNLDLSINEPRFNHQSILPGNSDPGLLGARPLSDFLGTSLDLPDGQVQNFRFRLDKVPTTATVPQQQIDAGGIRLKWSW